MFIPKAKFHQAHEHVQIVTSIYFTKHCGSLSLFANNVHTYKIKNDNIKQKQKKSSIMSPLKDLCVSVFGRVRQGSWSGFLYMYCQSNVKKNQVIIYLSCMTSGCNQILCFSTWIKKSVRIKWWWYSNTGEIKYLFSVALYSSERLLRLLCASLHL